LKKDTGVSLNVDNLRATCDELVQVIGAERFRRISATFTPEKTRGLPAYHLMRAQAHPLAVEWHELMQAVEKSEETRTIALPERSLFLLDHLVRLKLLTAVPGIERILLRLEQRDQYYSAMFEILILSFYHERGAPIEVVAEASRSGQRRADFVIRHGSQCVHIECKSLEDHSRKEGRIWEQIESSIMRALSSDKRCWRVLIIATRPVGGKDISTIVSLASAQIKQGALDSFATPDGGVIVSFESSSAWPDAWQLGGIESIERRTDRGFIEAELSTNEAGAPLHRNVMVVESIPFYNPDETKRILDDVSDAHGQIPDGICGVVHIEIPFRESGRLLDIADVAFQRTFGFIKKKRRLNAAVLSARTLRKGIKDGENPISDYYVVIPNPEAATHLPNDFAILGWDERLPEIRKETIWQTIRWWVKVIRIFLFHKPHAWPKNINRPSDWSAVSGREGTVLIEFGINQPLPEQLGRSIVNYCSRDGRRQIRLWQSFKNHFRADIVDVSFGRRTFRTDLNDLAVGVAHKLAVGWSAESPTAAIDGRLLEPIADA
jgi:hypothetical protein